jgi:threonyl-tRNA synthetase
VSVIPISPELGDAARSLVEKLKAAGLRVGFDAELREDYRERIKLASQMKVPYMAILGKREAEAGTVTLRARGAEKAQTTMPVDEAVAKLRTEMETRAVTS